MGSLYAPCPSCGKRPSDAAGAPYGQVLDVDDDDAEAGGLELALNTPVASVRGGGAPAAGQGGARFGDDDLDLDLDLEVGPSLEVALDGVRPAAAESALAAVAVGASLGGPPPPPTAGYPAREGQPAARTGEHDRYELIALAGYGLPPTGLLAAPGYALHVRRRRADLRRELSRLHAERAGAEERQRQLLGDVVAVYRAAAGDAATASPLLEPLRRVEQLAVDREAALRATNAAYGAAVAPYDGQIAALEQERVAREAAAEEGRLELRRREEGRARAEAQRRRAEIELRGAHDAARLAAGPDATHAPPEHAARILAIEQQRDARARETEEWGRACKEGRRVVTEREDAVSEVVLRLRALRRERERVAGTFAASLGVHAAGTREADLERAQVTAEIGARLLETQGAALPEHLRQRAQAEREALLALDRSIERHQLALDLADAGVERRGLLLLGALAGGVVVLLAVLML